MTLEYRTAPEDAGRKLFYILRYRMHISAGMIRRYKFQTKFFVNDIPVHTDYILNDGDLIQIPLPKEYADFPPEPGPLDILYEDEAIICVNKPAGIIIHPSATRDVGTLANRILTHTGGTVHALNRLDRDTTGVIIFAKNGYIKSILTEDLLGGKIRKTYTAPVFGELPKTDGIIDLPIDRVNEYSLWRMIDIDGKPAQTEYHLLKKCAAWNLYQFHPVTGRTHQIRLHCMASGAPILGDPVYNSPESKAFSDELGLQYQLLCCTEMAFRHPLTGDPMEITAVPDYFNAPWFQTEYEK